MRPKLQRKEVYFFRGAYRGFTEKYGKVISPYFSSYLKASFYQDTRRVFSLSLDLSQVEKKKVWVLKK